MRVLIWYLVAVNVLTYLVYWWDKYRVTLLSIEGDWDEAREQLRVFVVDLGYDS